MQRRVITIVAAIATTLPVALTGASVAAAKDFPETWHLKSLFSHSRQDDGATQDTHWFYEDHAAPTDPCGVSHNESGEQLITLRRPNTNIDLTFHPDGTVSPSTFTIPARLRRSATEVNDYSQIDPKRCPGVGRGDGTGGTSTTNFTDIPVTAGGCGELDGWAVITLRVRGDRLLMHGYFTQDGYNRLINDPLGACPFFFGATQKPAEAIGTVIDTSWPLSRAELFHSHRYGHWFYDINAEEEHVEHRTYTGNPHGVTVSSMWMILMYRDHPIRTRRH